MKKRKEKRLWSQRQICQNSMNKPCNVLNLRGLEVLLFQNWYKNEKKCLAHSKILSSLELLFLLLLLFYCVPDTVCSRYIHLSYLILTVTLMKIVINPSLAGQTEKLYTLPQVTNLVSIRAGFINTAWPQSPHSFSFMIVPVDTVLWNFIVTWEWFLCEGYVWDHYRWDFSQG